MLAVRGERQRLDELHRRQRQWRVEMRKQCAAARMLEAQGFVVEYVEEHWGRRFAAAFIEGVRLIDNVPIG